MEKVIILITFWFIWMARNSTKHEDTRLDSVKTCNFIRGYLRKLELYGNNSKEDPGCMMNGLWNLVKWVRPAHSTIKINIDGSFNANKMAAGVVEFSGISEGIVFSIVLYLSLL